MKRSAQSLLDRSGFLDENNGIFGLKWNSLQIFSVRQFGFDFFIAHRGVRDSYSTACCTQWIETLNSRKYTAVFVFPSLLRFGIANASAIALGFEVNPMLIRLLLLMLCLNPFAPLVAQDVPFKSTSKWQASVMMPCICVAQLDLKNQPKILSVLLPIPEVRIREETYEVDVPTKSKDGTTVIRKEQRTRKTYQLFSMERREIPLVDVEVHDLEGNKLSDESITERFAKPIHVLYGQAPDLYSRAVLRDDLLVLLPVAGKQLPKVTPKDSGGKKSR